MTEPKHYTQAEVQQLALRLWKPLIDRPDNEEVVSNYFFGARNLLGDDVWNVFTRLPMTESEMCYAIRAAMHPALNHTEKPERYLAEILIAGIKSKFAPITHELEPEQEASNINMSNVIQLPFQRAKHAKAGGQN